MADGVGTLPPGAEYAIMDVTVGFNFAAAGWSETSHAIVTGADPYGTLREEMKSYNDARRKLLAEGADIEFMRISRRNKFRDADTKQKPEFNMGAGKVAGAAADVARALAVRIEDETNQVHSVVYFHGLAKTDDPANGPAKRPNLLTDNVKNWITFLKSFWGLENGNRRNRAVIWVIPTYNRVIAGANTSAATGFHINDEGFINLTINSAMNPILGEKLKLNVPRERCTKGLAGIHRVIGVGVPAAGMVVVTLKKRLCCAPQNLQGVIGTVNRRAEQFVTIDEIAFDSFTNHKVGRPFGSPVGRLPGKCC